MSLALRLFGPVPQQSLLGLLAPFLPGGAPSSGISVPDLALPRQAWAADTVVVYRSASVTARLATLGPGFPVTITDATLVGTVRWDHITWSGPTRASGGSGWVPHTALASVGTVDTATADPGALSQGLAAALAPFGSRAGIVVYYPDQRQMYTSGADVAFPLGDGIRGILVTELLASPLAAQPMIAGQTVQHVAQGVAVGDPGALSLTYTQLGGGAQVVAFLSDMSVVGITPDSSSWSAVSATPRGLAQYYAALAGVTPGAGGLGASLRTQALAALAPDAATIALAGLGAPLPQGASVLLVTGTAQAADGWSMNAAGVITASSGVRYVVALSISGQLSPGAARAAIGGVLGQVAAIVAA
jgi:hypothetical protein